MPTFSNIFNEYRVSLDSLREFVTVLAPVLQKQVGDSEQQHIEEVSNLFKQIVILMANPDSKIHELLENATFKVKLNAPTSPTEAPTSTNQVSEDLRTYEQLDSPEQAQLLDIAQELRRHSRESAVEQLHVPLLYRSSLISLISSTEWCLSQIIHHVMKHFSGKIKLDKTFTVDELIKRGTLDQVIEDAIDTKVESVLRDKVEEQIAFLKKTFNGCSFKLIDVDLPALIEVYARRNIVVHAGGLVNRRYLERIEAAGTPSNDAPAIGSPLTVDGEYVRRAISLFESAFGILILTIWKHLYPKEDRATVINQTMDHINEQRYDIGATWSMFSSRDSGLEESSKLNATFNYWQCMKWLGRFEEVRDQVQAEDLSARPKIYRLARYALLEDNDEFYAMLPNALAENAITKGSFRTWPIFKEMRVDARSADYCSNVSPELPVDDGTEESSSDLPGTFLPPRAQNLN